MKKEKMILLLLLAIFGWRQPVQAAAGENKIVVLTDTHVMAPELLVSEGDAWTNYLDKERKLVDYSQELFDVMINSIKSEIQPDLVLITGDLSKDGEKASHNYVVSKLDELKVAGIPTLVIPGNHDRGANGNAVYYNGAGTTPAETADNDWFASRYANYGYGTDSERESTTLTYACEPIAGLVVIGIDSGTDGNISATTLAWVCEKAIEARSKGKRVIAMMHHPLIEHVTNSSMLVSTVSVVNSDEVRNALANAGVKVVFTGHFHTSDIAKDYNDEMTKEIFDVNTGSLISYPCDYRLVTLSNDLYDLSLTTEHISSVPSKTEFGTYAKDRLHASIKKIVKQKAEAKLGDLAPYMTSIIETTSQNVADAYIIHAEGNENDVDTESIFDNLSVAFLAMDGTKNMCESMLHDLAPYGTERENRTNDLTLTTELPATVKLASDGYSTYCAERALDMTKSEGLEAYIVKNITDTKVVLQSVSKIPAEEGFILKGTEDAVYDLFTTTDATDDVTENQLHGTLSTTAAPANTFVLSTQGGNSGFFPVKTGLTIPAHKAYLTISGGMARELFFDDVTGIDDAVRQKRLIGSAWYNLQGQKVEKPSKGVYINNGKMVIIK